MWNEDKKNSVIIPGSGNSSIEILRNSDGTTSSIKEFNTDGSLLHEIVFDYDNIGDYVTKEYLPNGTVKEQQVSGKSFGLGRNSMYSWDKTLIQKVAEYNMNEKKSTTSDGSYFSAAPTSNEPKAAPLEPPKTKDETVKEEPTKKEAKPEPTPTPTPAPQPVETQDIEPQPAPSPRPTTTPNAESNKTNGAKKASNPEPTPDPNQRLHTPTDLAPATEEELIQSNGEYLHKYLTNIDSKVKALAVSTFDLSVTSTTSVPAQEVALIDSLKTAIKSLCSKLHDEILAFDKVGGRFRSLDLELDEKTTQLTKDLATNLTSEELDIPIKQLNKSDYSLDELQQEYEQYLKEKAAYDKEAAKLKEGQKKEIIPGPGDGYTEIIINKNGSTGSLTEYDSDGEISYDIEFERKRNGEYVATEYGPNGEKKEYQRGINGTYMYNGKTYIWDRDSKRMVDYEKYLANQKTSTPTSTPTPTATLTAGVGVGAGVTAAVTDQNPTVDTSAPSTEEVDAITSAAPAVNKPEEEQTPAPVSEQVDTEEEVDAITGADPVVKKPEEEVEPEVETPAEEPKDEEVDAITGADPVVKKTEEQAEPEVETPAEEPKEEEVDAITGADPVVKKPEEEVEPEVETPAEEPKEEEVDAITGADPVVKKPEEEVEPEAETPAEETPSEETSKEEPEVTAEKVPEEETPAEESPKEETPTEETPAEETPTEETPKEDDPVETKPRTSPKPSSPSTPEPEQKPEETPKQPEETPEEEPKPSTPEPEPEPTPETPSEPEQPEPSVEPEPTVEPEPEVEPEPVVEPDPEPEPSTPSKPKKPDPIPDPDKPKKPTPIPTPDKPKKPSGSNEYINTDEDIPEPDPIIEPEENIDIPEEEEIPFIEPEEEIVEPEIEEEPEVEPEPSTEEPQDDGDSHVLRNIGIMTAVGAGVGAAAYATHKAIEKKNSDDSHYSYEKDSNDEGESDFKENDYYAEEFKEY